MQHINGPHKGAITEDGVLCALSSHLHLSTPSPVLRVVWHRVTTRHVTLEVGQMNPAACKVLAETLITSYNHMWRQWTLVSHPFPKLFTHLFPEVRGSWEQVCARHHHHHHNHHHTK